MLRAPNPHLLRKARSRSLLGVTKRGSLENRHGQFKSLPQKLVKLRVHHYSSRIWYEWKNIWKQRRGITQINQTNCWLPPQSANYSITQYNYPTYLWKQIKVQQLYRSILTIHQPSFLPPPFFFYKLLPPEICTLCNKPYPSHTVMNNDCSRPWRARAVLVLLLLVLKPEQTEKKTGPNNFTLLRIGGIRWFITGNIGNYNFIFHD